MKPASIFLLVSCLMAATALLLMMTNYKQNNASSVSLAGIGTFPGGQSTGGYEEFEFDQPVDDPYRQTRQTVHDSASLQNNLQPWMVVSGPCKGARSVSQLRDCIAKQRPEWSKSYNLEDGNISSTENYVYLKPGTMRVGTNSYKPSLEDVIKANKMPDLHPIYGKMKTLQDQLDVIKNSRNFDTEDLTPSTNQDWMDQTADLCCVDMFDTVCNQPCRAF